MLKRFCKALFFIIILLLLTIFLFDVFGTLDVRSGLTRQVFYGLVLVVIPCLTLYYAVKGLFSESKDWLALIVVFASISVAIVGIIFTLFLAPYGWETYSVVYEHNHLSFKKIEFQMKDVGAKGFQRRTVEVIYLTPLFMIVHPIDEEAVDTLEWRKL